jgi:hypothetical protein
MDPDIKYHLSVTEEEGVLFNARFGHAYILAGTLCDTSEKFDAP